MKRNHRNSTLFGLGLKYGLVVTLLSFFSPSNSQAQDLGDTFVHLFEWRWTDIATECEQHLGPKGYNAIQISPPQEHIQGEAWWTRYQPVSFNIDNSRSGTRAEFIDMVNRCNTVGVDIYVDAVINHMAAGSGTGTAGSSYSAGSSYPEFSSNDFHPDCPINPSDFSNNAYAVRNCWLVGLPDLATETNHVRQTIADYMNELLALGVRGFRIDASKHMPPADIQDIVNRLNTSAYVFQEVIDQGGEAITSSEYFGVADVTEFKYSSAIGRMFRTDQIRWLETFGPAWGFMPSDLAVVFTDNHDNQREGYEITTFKDGQLYDLANVFMLAWPYGYPKVMSSYDFTDFNQGPPGVPVHDGAQLNCFGSQWKCEHRWRPIANMVAFRKATANDANITNWWDNGNNQIAFGRGDAGFVVINRESGNLSRTFSTSLPAGEYCNVIDGDFDNGSCSGNTLLVDSLGNVNIEVAGMRAAAIHVDARIGASSTPPPEPPPAGEVTSTSICYDNNQSFANPHMHSWNAVPSGAIADTTWPGPAMQAQGNFFCIDPGVALSSLNIVFNDNGGAQTADLTYTGQGCYANNQWQSLEQCGFQVTESAPPPADTATTQICYDNADGYNDPHVYYWNPSPTGALADIAWPGIDMASTSGFFCHDTGASVDSLNVIFNDNGGAQTADLFMTGDNTCFRQGQWTSLLDCGIN